MNPKKDTRITIRLTPEQYESIAARASSAQMSVGTYVRAAERIKLRNDLNVTTPDTAERRKHGI